MKHVEILLMEEGELSLDGQTKPAGNIEIREFEDGEWMGGSYATYENLVEKVKEALEITDDKSLMWEPENGGEG